MTLFLTATSLAAIIGFALHKAPQNHAVEDSDWGRAEHVGAHGNATSASAELRGTGRAVNWATLQYPG